MRLFVADHRSILVRLREARGLSPRGLSIATGGSVTHETLRQWEMDPLGVSVPPWSLDKVHAVADVLGVPRDDLAALLGLSSPDDRAEAEKRLRRLVHGHATSPSALTLRRLDSEDYRALLYEHCGPEVSIDTDHADEARKSRRDTLVGNIALGQRDRIVRWLRDTNRDDIAHELERLADLDWEYKHPQESNK